LGHVAVLSDLRRALGRRVVFKEAVGVGLATAPEFLGRGKSFLPGNR
jgi:hypothetical protein